MTTDAEAPRESGFHPRTAALAREFREHRGYRLANDYGDVLEEYWACRQRVAVGDLSALRKFEVLGPDAEALTAYCLTRDIRRLAVGRVTYSALCDEAGGMIDHGTLFRLGADNFRWVGASDDGGAWLRPQAEALGLRVWIRPSSDLLHNLAVQGPKSREVLRDLVWTPPAQPSVAELGRFRFAVGRSGGFAGRSLVVSRTGATGELGYELWCHPRDAVALWDAVWQAGQPHGLAPLGLAALDMLRIEAGLIAAGHEFSGETDPFEAGIGCTVALDAKTDEFLGREALIRRKDAQRRMLVGLELAGDAPAAQGDAVWTGSAEIGLVTSATRSPLLEKPIALCRIDVTHGAPGTEVAVDPAEGPAERRPATVAALPFYDPEKTRLRA